MVRTIYTSGEIAQIVCKKDVCRLYLCLVFAVFLLLDNFVIDSIKVNSSIYCIREVQIFFEDFVTSSSTDAKAQIDCFGFGKLAMLF